MSNTSFSVYVNDFERGKKINNMVQIVYDIPLFPYID